MGGGSSCSLQFADEVEELLSDVHPQAFGAAHLLHSSTTDGQWVRVLGVVSPEVDNNLLCFLVI